LVLATTPGRLLGITPRGYRKLAAPSASG